MLFVGHELPSSKWYTVFMGNNLNNKDKPVSRYSAKELVDLAQVHVAEVLSFASAISRKTGLGHSEMSATEHLQQASEAGLTPKQLGERLGLSSGAVTALVDRLEKAGYAERRPHPRDRRSSVVNLRPANLEDATRYMRPLEKDLLEATAGLDDEERAVVGRYLEAVTEVFARHARP